MSQLTTEQQGNARIASQAAQRVSQRTANSDISSVDKSSQTQQITTTQVISQEVTARTITSVVTSESIIMGRTRLKKEDENNLAGSATIAAAAQKALKAQQTETQQTVDLTTSVTPQDRVAILQSKTFASKKSQADAARALRKLQSRCNHKYNISTRK